MPKTRQENDINNLKDVAYAKNKTELLWLKGLGVIYDENQIRQWHDQSYKCGLRWKWNQIVMTNKTRCSLCRKLDRTTMWSRLQV